MQIKNITGCFMGRWANESMSKMQNSPAQRYSIMSNMKIETENSLPQRHSKMSNLSFVEYCHPKHLKKKILTMQIRNIAGCFMGKRAVIKNSHAQKDSGNYKLAGAQ